MQEAYNIASSKSEERKVKDRNRKNNKTKKLGLLEVGDRVLIRNVVERGGPGKLRGYWEQDIYVVSEVKGENGVVYAVRKEGQTE